MGCDIHCIIEYKRPQSYSLSWDSFGTRSINPGRDYQWFANLAGVRGSPKGGKLFATGFGLPDHLSWATHDEITMRVDYNAQSALNLSAHTTTLELATKWVESGYSKWLDEVDANGRKFIITSPDYHSYGWCNLADWKKAVKGNHSIEIKALTAAMQAIAKAGAEVRLVFWFDN